MKNKLKKKVNTNNLNSTGNSLNNIYSGNNEILNNNIDTNTCNVSTNEMKKVTIRDLCPEEKQKIGELLKKLADEKEEKEKLKVLIEDEKRNYQIKIDSIMKEKENNNSSNISNVSILNNSVYYKAETFTENFIPNNSELKNENSCNFTSQSETQVDMKKLKDRFNNLFETLKKTAHNQEEYFVKLSINDDSCNISATPSLLKEESPQVLEHKPTAIEYVDAAINNKTSQDYFELKTPSKKYTSDDFSYPMTPSNNFDNILQTSILNINDEIRESLNNQEKSFEFSEDVYTSKNLIKNDSTIISAEKLHNLREKIQFDKKMEEKNIKKKCLNKITNSSSKYKEMLNRVRERSQEHSKSQVKINDYNLEGNELAISNNNFEINSLSSKYRQSSLTNNNNSNNINNFNKKNFYSCTDSKYTLAESNSGRKFDEDDEQLISILNCNPSKNDLVNGYRKKFDIKESSLDIKADFYENHLFDLIDEMESKEEFNINKSHHKNLKIYEKNMKINYELEKEININMMEIENDLQEIIIKGYDH